MVRKKRKNKIIGDINFDILNPEMIDFLIQGGIITLPKKKVNIPKDRRWNMKKLNSRLLQALQEGKSIREISKMFEDIIGDNWDSQIRNARTMTTAAENKGRNDSYKKLSIEGIVMKKEWMATPDDRTRPSHIDMDGEEQNIGAIFSNGCEYPADGRGPAEEVWNCRCSMRAHVLGFRRSDGSISHVERGNDSGLHEEQMKEEKERRNAKNK